MPKTDGVTRRRTECVELCDVTPERDDFVAQEWEVFRERTANGRSMEVIELADSIIASTDDPRRIVQALIEKLAARLNMGEARSLGPLIGEINARLHGISDSRLVGEFHSIAGRTFERGLQQLVDSFPPVRVHPEPRL